MNDVLFIFIKHVRYRITGLILIVLLVVAVLLIAVPVVVVGVHIVCPLAGTAPVIVV